MTASVGKVSDVDYYVGSVGGGRENYYLDAVAGGEPAGRWSGKLAEKVGLTGEVVGDEMHDLFDTFEAPDGTQLGQRPGQYRTAEERFDEWMAEHPDALPEDVERARARIERTTRKANLGVDVTFSVPKSVSVIHTAVWRAELKAERDGDSSRVVSSRSARLAIETAIEKANAAMLDYVSEVAVARNNRHGATGQAGRWVKADGLAVASFPQHTSRSIDPQLHHHNVLLNRVECPDGEYRAIDLTDLMDQQFAFTAVADRTLAEELSALGLKVGLRKDPENSRPSWEVVGVNPQVCDLFSTRRHVIRGKLGEAVERAEEQFGRKLTPTEIGRLGQEVTLRSRPGKTHDGESWEEMNDRWHRQLVAEVGAGLGPIADGVIDTLAAGRVQEARQWSPTAVCAAAVEAISERKTRWGSDELMWELEQRLPILGPGVDYKDVLAQLTAKALADPRLVTKVAGKEDLPVPRAILAAGESYVRPAEVQYASTHSLEAENALRKAAIDRGCHRVDGAEVDAWLSGNLRMIGEDQRAAVRGLASSDAALAVLIGPAGTGKSFTAGALDGVWRALSGGGRVQGLAVSQIAADVLAKDGAPKPPDGVDRLAEGGVQVTANISAWLDAQQRLAGRGGKVRPTDHQFRVRARDIVLVDEASMVSRAELDRIRAVVEDAGARMVLTGDPRQLSAVQAGGVMGLLDGHAEHYSLSEVRRFEAHWEREASLRLRDHDADVLRDYDRHGRIVDAESMDAAVDQAADVAAADRIAGRRVVVVAGTNEEAATVSAAVRDRLVAAGLVDAAGVELAKHGGLAGVGDDIMCRQNDRRLGVTNRELYRVTEVGEDGSLTVAGLESGELLRLSGRYVRDHVASGYAGTVHATQGISVDAGYGVTGGQLDAEALYVMLTRGREMNKVFVALDQDRAESPAQAVRELPSGKFAVVEASTDRSRPSGRAVLEDALARESQAAEAGLVAMERDDDRLASLDTIQGRIEDGVRVVCRGRLEQQLDQLTAIGLLSEYDRNRLATDQATEHLSRLLRSVEQAGHDPGAVLTHAVIDERGLADATSVAQILSARVTATAGDAVGDPPTAAPIPKGGTQDVDTYLQRLHSRADGRRRDLGAQVAQEQPGWAVRALGPVPDGADRRLEWERRAGVVAGHREATGWDDRLRAIGDAPGITSTERRAAWWDAWDALGRPEEGREEAAMPEGRLRCRMEAWQREQEWAPTHVDDAMKAASLRSEEARVEAIRAGEDDDAGAEDVHVARELDRVARARDAWAAETALTRIAAERAERELLDRGIEVGGEDDLTTAEEWLSAQQEADRDEDPHRVITDPDVADHARETATAAGVEVRSGDLAVVEHAGPERRTRAAHDTLPVDPGRLEVELAAQRAAAAAEEMANRASLEESSTRLHVDEYDTAYDAEFREQQADHLAAEYAAE